MTTTNRLIAAVRRCCLTIPDKRQGQNTTYAMADFGMAAFSAFFMQSPSFLAHQRHLAAGQGRSNCQTLFAMHRIPCDNQIRAMLDPVEPEQFHPAFAAALVELEQSGAIDQLRVLEDHVLIALDGSEYYCSTELHCPNCSTRKHSNGAVEYHHALLAAEPAPAKAGAGLPRPQPCGAAGAGVHRPAGWPREARLREPRHAALARGAWRPLCPAQAGVSGR